MSEDLNILPIKIDLLIKSLTNFRLRFRIQILSLLLETKMVYIYLSYLEPHKKKKEKKKVLWYNVIMWFESINDRDELLLL